MINRDPALVQTASPVQTGEKLPSSETPFSLEWLRAIDPRIFTPYTWEHGRSTTIRLRTPDSSLSVNVERIISHCVDNTVEIHDEVHLVNGSEAGNQGEITQLNYGFDSDEKLVDFDRALTVSDHLQRMVNTMSEFVQIPGATIYASNYDVGTESDFVSDGTQWVEVRSRNPAPVLPEIAIGHLAIGPPTV